MPIIRSWRLYVCYYRLWFALSWLLVVGVQVQGSRLCVRDEGCCSTESSNIPHPESIADCPASDLQQPTNKASRTIGSNNTHIVSSSWWWTWKCPKHFEHIISAIKHSVTSSWFFFSTHLQTMHGQTHIKLEERVWGSACGNFFFLWPLYRCSILVGLCLYETWRLPSCVFVETKLLRICHIQITTKRTLFVTNNLHLANSIYKQRDSGNHKAFLFIVGTAVCYDALIAFCHTWRNETVSGMRTSTRFI
jgi:hypothetical protein